MANSRNIIRYATQALEESENSDYFGEEISCPYWEDFTNYAYVAKHYKRILSTHHSPIENKYRVKYIINQSSGIDFLCRSSLLVELPALSLTPESKEKGIQIAWRKNIFHNIINDATLRFDDEIITSFNNNWLNIYLYVKGKARPGDISFYENMIGNRPELISWTSDIPSAKIACPQPWPYADSHKHAILINNAYGFPIEHEYIFTLRLEDLLIARRKISDTQYEEIPFSRDMLTHKLIEKIEFPRMTADTVVLNHYITEGLEVFKESISQLNTRRHFDHIMYYNFCLRNTDIMLDVDIGMKMQKSSVIKSVCWILQDAETGQYIDQQLIHSIKFHKQNYIISEEQDPFYFETVDPWYNNENFQGRPRHLGQIHFTMYGSGHNDLDVGIVGNHTIRFNFQKITSPSQIILHVFVCTVGSYYAKEGKLVVEI